MNQVINELLREATILYLLQEQDKLSWDEFADQVPDISKGNTTVKFRTALSYGSSAKGDDAAAYAEAINQIQNGINSGEIDRNTIPTDGNFKQNVPSKVQEPSGAAPSEEPKTSGPAADTDKMGADDVADAVRSDNGQVSGKEGEKGGEEKKEDINSPEVAKKATEIEKKENNLTPKQAKIEENKKEFLSNIVGAMLQSTSIPTGAGKYNMSREDFEIYKNFLSDSKPEVPSIDVSDKELDEVFSDIKEKLGPKGYSSFINKAKGAGAPPPDVRTDLARARAVVKSYISTGGVSVVSGERIPFYDTQLDHVVSLANGGVDGGDNWQWMEARYNQFKLEFSDDELRDKIDTAMKKSPEEDKLKTLQTEYKNYARNSMVDFFKRSGYSSLTRQDILNAKGEAGSQLIKAVAETAKISRYKNVPGGAGGGTRTRGTALPMSVLKKKIVKELELQPKSAHTDVNEEFFDIINELAVKQDEIGKVKDSIKQQKLSKEKPNESFYYLKGYTDMEYLIEMAKQV